MVRIAVRAVIPGRIRSCHISRFWVWGFACGCGAGKLLALGGSRLQKGQGQEAPHP